MKKEPEELFDADQEAERLRFMLELFEKPAPEPPAKDNVIIFRECLSSRKC